MRNYRFESRFLHRVVDAILGKEMDNPPSPERMRNEYLVRFLLMFLPVLLALVVFDYFSGEQPVSAHRLIAFIMLISCLAALKAGRFSLAIDILFFGVIISSFLGFAIRYYLSGTTVATIESISLIELTLFATISFVGLYSGSRFRVDLMFALALIFDVSGFLLPYGIAFGSVSSRVIIIALHGSAYGFGLFLVAYFDNISRTAESRRLMNRRLEELVTEANEGGIARLESLSHDIRSPITGILGVHALLAETSLDQEQRQYLDILGKSNKLLLDIVESILDSPGKSESPEWDRAALMGLFGSALAPYRAAARAKGVVFKRRVFGAPCKLSLSRSDLLRVLGNLADNALKYTDSGWIAFSCVIKPEGTIISVTDTGRGMDAGRLLAVRSGEAEPDPDIPGSRGIGLSGVRRMVELAGGSFEVRSQSGRGTKVTLIFPR